MQVTNLKFLYRPPSKEDLFQSLGTYSIRANFDGVQYGIWAYIDSEVTDEMYDLFKAEFIEEVLGDINV